MSSILIETVDLKKYFKKKAGMLHAVDGVNFRINKGETFGVVGESGCGKSTLGRVILRLIEPTDGKVLLEGKDIAHFNRKDLKKVRREMQIIFQDPYSSINPRMSVQEIIAEPLIVNKVFKTKAELYDRVAYLMETVGLSERVGIAYPHELDGGRRQRVGVARALALDPKFIVCDEPVSALDVSIQAQILNLLMDLQDQMGLTYLFITHDLSVVKHISNEIAVMYLGHCVEWAPKHELFQNPLHPYSKALLSAIPVPNPAMRSKSMEVIKGELSSPINPKPGCRFSPRCPYVSEKCLGRDIELKHLGGDHWVACTLY
jgi:peptide/nickel transport system ATP-binding protein